MLLGHSQDLPRTLPGCILVVFRTLPGHSGDYRHTPGPFSKAPKVGHLHEFSFTCMAGDKFLVCDNEGVLWDSLGMRTGYLWNLTGTFRDTLRMFPKTLPDIHGTLQGHCRDYDPEIAGIKY